MSTELAKFETSFEQLNVRTGVYAGCFRDEEALEQSDGKLTIDRVASNKLFDRPSIQRLEKTVKADVPSVRWVCWGQPSEALYSPSALPFASGEWPSCRPSRRVAFAKGRSKAFL